MTGQITDTSDASGGASDAPANGGTPPPDGTTPTETPTTPAANTPSSSSDSRPFWLTLVLIGIAVVILVGFAAIVVYMLRYSGAKTTEVVWNRRVFVFGGIQAIAFTAVGWLFGREVNRGTAEAAQEQAKEAADDAKTANEAAQVKATEAAEARVKGTTLAAAVKASAENAQPEISPSDPGFATASIATNSSQLQSLASLVDLLYPEGPS